MYSEPFSKVKPMSSLLTMKWMEQPNNLEYINIENCIFFNGNDHVGVVSMTNLELFEFTIHKYICKKIYILALNMIGYTLYKLVAFLYDNISE